MFEDDDITFEVVANHEEQYSIWPEFKEIPAGWIAVGPKGTKEECLDYIEQIWTDMRPKSLRDKMRERDGADVDAAETPAQILELAEEIVSEHGDAVREYEEGRPERFGWFVARVADSLDEDELDPDAVRNALRNSLPPHKIPEDYA